jgi:hypothetical protein
MAAPSSPGTTTASGAPAAQAPPALRASLHQLELTCEPRPSVLAPCYTEIVTAMTARAVDFDAALTEALSSILGGIFVDQSLGGEVAGAALPAELIIRGVAPSLRVDGESAALRLELRTELRDPPR